MTARWKKLRHNVHRIGPCLVDESIMLRVVGVGPGACQEQLGRKQLMRQRPWPRPRFAHRRVCRRSSPLITRTIQPLGFDPKELSEANAMG